MSDEPLLFNARRREQIKPPDFVFPDGRRPRKRCNECGGIFDVEAGFARAGHAKDSSGLLYIYSRPVCIGCEQGQRDRAKAENRWRIKARDTLRRHSAKFNVTRNLSLSTDEFSDRFVWRIERIAHDMSHAFENTCNYCWKPYGEMPNGHWNVTVDIYDRGADPFYSNTRICCQTCNREKGQMTPEQWARRLQYWQEKRDHDQKFPRMRQPGLPLFIIDERPA